MTISSLKAAEWTPEIVSRFWSDLAKTQLTSLAFAKSGGKGFIVAFDHILRQGLTILDFGAGNGDLAELMCQRGLRVACYEPFQDPINTISSSLSNTSNFLGFVDTESDKTYDVVLLTEVVEHILDKDLDQTIERLYRFVKPGGTIIVTTPNNENLELGKCLCPMCQTFFHRWQHVRSFTSESLSGLFLRHGFTPVTTHMLEFNDQLYVQYDTLWGTGKPGDYLPFYLYEIRNNRPSKSGSENILVYIGTRPDD